MGFRIVSFVKVLWEIWKIQGREKERWKIMSFFKILSGLKRVVQNPLVHGVLRTISPLATTIIDLIFNAEEEFTGEKQGPVRLAAVKSDFDNYLSLFNNVLSPRNEQITYDQSLLEQSINAHVAVANAQALAITLDEKLRQSMKISPIQNAPSQPPPSASVVS